MYHIQKASSIVEVDPRVDKSPGQEAQDHVATEHLTESQTTTSFQPTQGTRIQQFSVGLDTNNVVDSPNATTAGAHTRNPQPVETDGRLKTFPTLFIVSGLFLFVALSLCPIFFFERLLLLI